MAVPRQRRQGDNPCRTDRKFATKFMWRKMAGGIFAKKSGKKPLECMNFLDKMADQMVARAETFQDFASY